MGKCSCNPGGKENDITNLMHVCIIKDADLPKTEASANNASVWKEVNERYWELEMGQFDGFQEFNFFRAINPSFYSGNQEKKPGIVVGNQDIFEKYKNLYDMCYIDTYRVEKTAGSDGEEEATDTEGAATETIWIPDFRELSANANNVPKVEDITSLRRLYLKVERNIIAFPLLPGADSIDQLLETEEAIVNACTVLKGKHFIDPGAFVKWGGLKKKRMKQLNSKGVAVKSTDEYAKSAGILRWWPQGRATGYGVDDGFTITINEFEHFKMEWTSHGGDFPNKFHTFFRSLNELHKNLKRQQVGGFWKEPKYGYISVDPAKFGAMFTCELDLVLGAIPIYFTPEEMNIDCGEVLGVSLTALETKNMYTMRVLNTQWKTEDEHFGVLLAAVNRLAQVDRSLYYSPRKAGDTLFDLKI